MGQCATVYHKEKSDVFLSHGQKHPNLFHWMTFMASRQCHHTPERERVAEKQAAL